MNTDALVILYAFVLGSFLLAGATLPFFLA